MNEKEQNSKEYKVRKRCKIILSAKQEIFLEKIIKFPKVEA
jgi:hypothetical protein